MEITKTQVFPLRGNEGKLKAFARITIDGELLLSSLRVYDSFNGLFVSFPADLSHGGEDYRHYYYPVTKELRNKIQNAIIDEYNKIISEKGDPKKPGSKVNYFKTEQLQALSTLYPNGRVLDKPLQNEEYEPVLISRIFDNGNHLYFFIDNEGKLDEHTQLGDWEEYDD